MGSLGRIDTQEVSLRNCICLAQHPIAAFFHLLFKFAALALYIFGAWFSVDYVTTFVLCVLLLAFDFWTVKNITGRLLVGLRWWARTRDDGSNEWHFESAPAGRATSALDQRIFWWTLYATPVVWFMLASLALIRFNIDWLLVDLVAIGLTGANLYCYFKCSTDAKRVRETLASGAIAGISQYLPGALPALGSSMLSALGSRFSTPAAPAAAAGGATAPVLAGDPTVGDDDDRRPII